MLALKTKSGERAGDEDDRMARPLLEARNVSLAADVEVGRACALRRADLAALDGSNKRIIITGNTRTRAMAR